jgi:hypothetical protein
MVLLAAQSAHAQVHAAARTTGNAQGPWTGRAAFNAQGEQVQAAGRRGVNGDGQGNLSGAAGSGFSTASGGQGLRTRSFERNADGSVSARNEASASTANGGSASSQSSFTRSADGSSASGERSTSVSNTRTGVTFDGSTSYAKGSGFSRSASCTDAAGNTVSCGNRR